MRADDEQRRHSRHEKHGTQAKPPDHEDHGRDDDCNDRILPR
jgi:hypothetical protein